MIVISYEIFWKTLKDKKISTYTLINRHKISSSTLTRLRHDKPLSSVTINDLCRILGCRIEEIATYIDDKEDQIL